MEFKTQGNVTWPIAAVMVAGLLVKGAVILAIIAFFARWMGLI